MPEKETPTERDYDLAHDIVMRAEQWQTYTLGEWRDCIAALIAADREEERECLDAAIDYIEKTPCDPDIYPDQWAAYQRYKKAREALKGGE